MMELIEGLEIADTQLRFVGAFKRSPGTAASAMRAWSRAASRTLSRFDMEHHG
jgi:hypothetical protein